MSKCSAIYTQVKVVITKGSSELLANSVRQSYKIRDKMEISV